MQKKSLILMFIILGTLAIPVNAQKKGYTIGYVITLEGDTLQGFVKDRSFGPFAELYTKIRFKSKKLRFKRKFRADDIQGYGYKGKYFEAVPLREESSFFKFRYYANPGSQRVFLKVIEKNQFLTYYHWEYVHDDNNYLDYVPLFYLKDDHEMVRISQGIFGVKRKQLSAYFKDCPKLVHGIKRKELNSAQEIFEFYNDQCGTINTFDK